MCEQFVEQGGGVVVVEREGRDCVGFVEGVLEGEEQGAQFVGELGEDWGRLGEELGDWGAGLKACLEDFVELLLAGCGVCLHCVVLYCMFRGYSFVVRPSSKISRQ